MELSSERIIEIINSKYKINKTSQELLELAKSTRNLLENIIEPILENNYGTEQSNIDSHNPQLWEYGHVLFFIEKHALRHIINYNYPLNENINNDIYDSYQINSKDRRNAVMAPLEKLIEYKIYLFDYIVNLLSSPIELLSNHINYMIHFALIHVHMHIESFLFTNQMVYKQLPSCFKYIKLDKPNNILKEETIDINGYSFIQGNSDGYGFDNERPCFNVNVEDFKMNMYKTTFYQYTEFIKSGEYLNDDNWSPQGLRWRDSHKRTLPLYVENDGDNNLFVSYFEHKIPIENLYNHPIIHVSWYEAEAYCKWKKGHLMSETQYEYMAKKNIVDYEINSNYKNNWITPIKKKSIELFGNCWIWCKETIYPYDRFTIDPLYREMSYPFFGFKKICRGGAWCVPDDLIYPEYRNAQYPDCIKQYIGFYVVY